MTTPERNRALVCEFRDVLDDGFAGKDGVRRFLARGKTIAFAVTRRHAETLAAMFDEHFADLKLQPATRNAHPALKNIGIGSWSGVRYPRPASTIRSRRAGQ